MSRWSRSRRLVIVTYIMLISLLVAVAGYVFYVYAPPTCFDGEQNGLEEDVDCGGGCQLVCPFAAVEPNVLWARALEVGPGVYNFVGLVENPNFNVGTNMNYVFRGFNDKNIQIAEEFGTVTMYPTQKQVLFMPSIYTGERRISRLFLSLREHSGWYTIPQYQERIITERYILEDEQSDPKLEVVLYNTHPKTIRDVTVVAVVFDQDANVHQASQTFVEEIPGAARASAFFTWREPFEQEIERVEVYVLESQEL